MKFADIHSHRSWPDEATIRNLPFGEADQVLSSPVSGLFSTGIHPWQSDMPTDNWLEKLQTYCADPRIVLVGECGLDKNSALSIQLQTAIFEKHILLSEKFSKPLIIHCVGCFNELIALRNKHNPSQKWIIHGFRGKPALAVQILRTGCDISFGEKFNPESVRLVPADRLYIETDESTLPIADIYLKIASAKGCNTDELRAGNILISKFTI